MNGVFGFSMFVEAVTRGASNQRRICDVRNFVSYFYLPGNLTANAVVAREIYRLAYLSYKRQRTNPPKLRTVIFQMSLVYLWASFLSLWSIMHCKWSPTHYDDGNHFCVRATGSKTTDPDESPMISAGLGSLIGVGVCLAPIAYVFYVGFRIRKGRLLPIKGRTRALAMYFFRVVLVFGIFFVPMLILTAIIHNMNHGSQNTQGNNNGEDGDDEPNTVLFVLHAVMRSFPPMQLLVTLRLIMSKDDVDDAVRDAFDFVLHCRNRPWVVLPSSATTTTQRIRPRSSFLLGTVFSGGGSARVVGEDAGWEADDMYDINHDKKNNNDEEREHTTTTDTIALQDTSHHIEWNADSNSSIMILQEQQIPESPRSGAELQFHGKPTSYSLSEPSGVAAGNTAGHMLATIQGTAPTTRVTFQLIGGDDAISDVAEQTSPFSSRKELQNTP
ncbi:hypothetical protein ACA910_019615 [Epithemia clementina (nom. ined.)]